MGPFQSGKTTLLEALLARTGAIQRQGSVEAGSTVGDNSKEARDHKMSVELSVATTTFMDDSYTFIDCPGSIEFIHDMRAALPAVDAAVVVCEADEKKLPQLQIILRELEDLKIPRFLFLNKIDKVDSTLHDVLRMLQPASRSKLVLRQIPTFSGEIVNGFVDLALERAFVALPETAARRAQEADGLLDEIAATDLATLADGERLSGPDWTIEAVATPGHTSNHLCYGVVESGALFTGDHVMAWSTSIVAPPDGSMVDYMASLERLTTRSEQRSERFVLLQ